MWSGHDEPIARRFKEEFTGKKYLRACCNYSCRTDPWSIGNRKLRDDFHSLNNIGKVLSLKKESPS